MKLGTIFGPLFSKAIVDKLFRNVEVVISNTQGAREPIYFIDRKVLEVSAWGPTVGTSPIIIYISSYNLTTKV